MNNYKKAEKHQTIDPKREPHGYRTGQQVAVESMEQAEGTITGRGIRFAGFYYTCKTAEESNWYLKARVRRRWRMRVYHDRNSRGSIYIRARKGGRAEECRLMPGQEQFANMTYEDFAAYRQRESVRIALDVFQTKRQNEDSNNTFGGIE